MSYSPYGTSAGARCPCLSSKKVCVPTTNSSVSRSAGCPCLNNKKACVPKPTTSSMRNNSSVSKIGSQVSEPLMGVQQTINTIRKQLASNANNIESVRQCLKNNNVTNFPHIHTKVFSHSEKSAIGKKSGDNIASKLQDSTTLQQYSTLPRTSSTSVDQKKYSSGSNQTTISKKNLSASKSSVNQTTIYKHKTKSTESSIDITKFSKTDIPSSTKTSRNSSCTFNSINVSSSSKSSSTTNSLLKEQSRKQANSILLVGNTFEEQSIFDNRVLNEISLIPHTISRSRSLSPGYKGSSKGEEVKQNRHGKSNLSSLQVHSPHLSASKNISKSASNISVPNTDNNLSKCSDIKAVNQNASAKNNPIPFQRKSQFTFTLNIDFDDNVNSGQTTGKLAKVSFKGEQNW